MEIASANYADLTSDGTSMLVPFRRGDFITVDCLDANGESQDWGGASVALVESPDGRMLAVPDDEDGPVSGKTS